MLKIDNENNISMTRGDTAKFNITVVTLDNGSPYVITAFDTVLFTVRDKPKRDPNDIDFVFQKEAPLGILELSPEDTAGLPYVTYHYDVQITLANGEVYTIIEWKEYTLEKESS